MQTEQQPQSQDADALRDEERKARRAAKHAEATEQRELLKFRLQDERSEKFAAKLAGCGLPLPLTCTNCGDVSTVETACKQRWCPVCAWRIQMARVEKFEGAIQAMEWPLMLTLTQPNSADPETVRALRESWSKMRRRKLIQKQITGGIVAVEVTNTGNGWHPHIHAIVNCRWLAIHTPAPQRGDDPGTIEAKCNGAKLELSATWASIIKHHQAIVLAARIHDKTAAKYALKYCTKASELLACKERITPLIDVLSRTRLVSTFGDLHGKMGDLIDDDKPGCACPNCNAISSSIPSAVVSYLYRSSDAPIGPSLKYDQIK